VAAASRPARACAGGSRPRKGRRSVRCPVDGGDCLVPFRDARQACVGQRQQINIWPRGAQAQGPRPPPPPVFPFHLSASSRCSFLTSRISGTRYGFAGRAQVYKGADLGALRRRLVLFSTSSCCFLPALPTLGSSTLYLALATPCATLSGPRPNHVVASMDHDPKLMIILISSCGRQLMPRISRVWPSSSSFEAGKETASESEEIHLLPGRLGGRKMRSVSCLTW
jgi:hypothetical protein